MERIERWLMLIFVLMAAVGIAYGYWFLTKPSEKVGTVTIATAAPEVKKAPIVMKTPKQVAVYAGGSTIKSKLNLPAAVVADTHQDVIASSKLAASDRPRTISTVIDTETGKSQTFVREDPLPWMAFDRRGALGLAYGLKNGETALRLYGRHNLIQAKALHLGVQASIDRPMNGGKPDWFAGAHVEYQW